MRIAIQQLRVKVQQRQQRRDALINLRSGPAQQDRHRGDILPHRPVRKQANRLNGIAHASPQRAGIKLTNRLTGEADLTAIKLHQPVDHFQRGRFAGAGGAEQYAEFPFCHLQRQIFYRRFTVKGAGNVIKLNHLFSPAVRSAGGTAHQ